MDQESISPGSIVKTRRREWVRLPYDELEDVILIRPLVGTDKSIEGIYTPLEGIVQPGKFPPPSVENIKDHTSGGLLLDAARLILRSGAGPFRCLGRLSVTPRPYQLVPLLMALRLPIVRLLIADDVGIGKTVEAGLIAKELLERKEIKRIGVLCPPHLCNQWQQELSQKFQIDATIVRSVHQAEKNPEYDLNYANLLEHPHTIVSLDYAKSDLRFNRYMDNCPDLLIVDEIHTCANSNIFSTQQRYKLVNRIAQDPNKHLVLLTATPHSGIETSFQSILGFLKPEFEHWELDNLDESSRKELARYFIQRNRTDVQKWLGTDTPFPERESIECSYTLSPPYKKLFDEVYDFARGLVLAIEDNELTYTQQRGRYWSALAIIRCVMSSPKTAVATLQNQLDKIDLLSKPIDEFLAKSYVDDITDTDQVVDTSGSILVEQGRLSYNESEELILTNLINQAKNLGENQDYKLHKVINLVKDLIAEEYNPIIWCRYIETAKYVTKALQQQLNSQEDPENQIKIVAITGMQSESQRDAMIQQLSNSKKRIMVATDCVSEGTNLQEHYDAMIHYDLPWNPNRLEQREGRIDRYGQTSKKVKCILLYSTDNPVDGALLEVLIRKAIQIHKTLGVSVPVPMDSTSVQEAILKSLFKQTTRQLTLADVSDDTIFAQVNRIWDKAQSKESRTRFAQRSIKPDQVEQELKESDLILGSEQDVERFVVETCRVLNAGLIKKKNNCWQFSEIPECLDPDKYQSQLFSFTHPTPKDVKYIGRNHDIVEGLAHYIFSNALSNLSPSSVIASRCGVTVTSAVSAPTILLLLRLRHIIVSKKFPELLAEECLVEAFTGSPNNPSWLSNEKALELLRNATSEQNLSLTNKQNRLQKILTDLPLLESHFQTIAQERSRILKESHDRVRTVTTEGKVKVNPKLPMDLLGVYLFLPRD